LPKVISGKTRRLCVSSAAGVRIFQVIEYFYAITFGNCSNSVSDDFFEIAGDPASRYFEWVLGTSYHRLIGNPSQYQHLWHLRFLYKGASGGMRDAAYFTLTADQSILKNLSEMQR